jgi:hypothetical protein
MHQYSWEKNSHTWFMQLQQTMVPLRQYIILFFFGKYNIYMSELQTKRDGIILYYKKI